MGDDASSSSTLKKLGLSGLVAAAGAGAGLLLTTKPKRLLEAVSRLRGEAGEAGDTRDTRDVGRSTAEEAGRPMTQEVSDHFEARRRERRKRREQRQHAT
jgi:hypothetical protein